MDNTDAGGRNAVDFIRRQCRHVYGHQAVGQQTEIGETRQGAAAVVGNRCIYLALSFVYVHMDRDIEFFGDHGDSG